METKHTKGPWGIVAQTPKQSEKGATAYIIGHKDWNVKDMTGPAQATNDENIVCIIPHHNLKTCDANLKLVIAAPDLLLTLMKVKFDLDFYQSQVEKRGNGKDAFFIDTQGIVDFAINKATGKE